MYINKHIYIIIYISCINWSPFFLEILPFPPPLGALLGTLHLSQLHRADGEPRQGVRPLAVQGIGLVEVLHGLPWRPVVSWNGNLIGFKSQLIILISISYPWSSHHFPSCCWWIMANPHQNILWKPHSMVIELDFQTWVTIWVTTEKYRP